MIVWNDYLHTSKVLNLFILIIVKYKKWGVVWNHVVSDWENRWDEMTYNAPQAYNHGTSRCAKSTFDMGHFKCMKIFF